MTGARASRSDLSASQLYPAMNPDIRMIGGGGIAVGSNPTPSATFPFTSKQRSAPTSKIDIPETKEYRASRRPSLLC
jgi:hypothetical protein